MSGINRLSETKIKNLRPADKKQEFSDGDRLWLVVYPSGKKVWRVKWKVNYKQDQYTIGHYPSFSLKQAREERDKVTALLERGINPNDQRKADQKFAEEQLEKNTRTFRFVALEWYEKMTKNQSEATRRMKKQRLEKHVFPVIGG